MTIEEIRKGAPKYWIKREVKDPYGSSWRFLFGKYVWSRFDAYSSDGFTIVQGENYIGYKKRYSLTRLCYVYEYLFDNYESARFDWEKGIPSIQPTPIKPLT